MIKQKRITVYVPEDKYKQLRIRLIELGKSVSGWFREMINKLLSE